MCWHRWSKWQVIDRGEVLWRSTQSVVGMFLVQERTCEKCGKTQIGKERT